MQEKSPNLTELETRPVGRLLWEYSVPAVVGMLVMALYNVVDRIFIGHGVGPVAISGLAITFPVMNLTTALGVLIGVGAASRISILLGAKDLRGRAPGLRQRPDADCRQRYGLYRRFRHLHRPDTEGFRGQRRHAALCP